MRIIEDFFVKVFSLIILVLSIIIILIGFDFVKIGLLTEIVNFLFSNELKAKITLITCVIFSMFSIKLLVTSRRKPKNGKDGIVLENSNGKLIISRESLDNLIYTASKDIPGAENISSKTYLDLEQNLRVFVTVTISKDVAIKDLSTQLQTKIKSAIKQTADLDVAEVNVKIKNIVNKKSRRIKDSYEENKESVNVVETKEIPSEIITDVEEKNEDNNEEL